ncbi:hypothetical protein Riv7116_4024 [Rivularia sp. PCC 7116]|uniref:hypothetical protein n=1 Tax=Rivularia sp. PCC 7116 TaxID=373994 RepID=UPI00029F0821|nr:hypothetical protein [Rivularia sp. PCC 7116]AFY56464.1 hypothetical protein Riv7116_4024 [Rivularia sp. PCC 7116]
MNIESKILIFITITVCIAILAISIYPGALGSLFFALLLVSIICIPIFIVVGIFALIVLGRRGLFSKVNISWRLVRAISGIVLLSCILLQFYIPRRLAFLASKSAFEQIIASGKTASNRQLGLYKIDKYAVDSGGGKYFRVKTIGNGFSPDVTSYGFVYQPNRKASPFGNANYQVFNLYGNWYWFEASNDY